MLKQRLEFLSTFFEAMILKLCTGYLVHITEFVWIFFVISSIQAQIMGKKGLFQKWDSVIKVNFNYLWNLDEIFFTNQLKDGECNGDNYFSNFWCHAYN